MMLTLLLSLLSSLLVRALGQTEFYYVYYPNEANWIHLIQMSFSDDGERFVVNIEVNGDHWCALGFASHGTTLGFMEGVDAWVFGDFGNDAGLEVVEFALGDHNIGSDDKAQNLDVGQVYSSGSSTQVHVERDVNTNTRDDYSIAQGGTLCILYAFGRTWQVESGHNSTSRGMECFDVTGTTSPPTPAPTYVPTPAPSDAPTARPTKWPTIEGETGRPTPSPTREPTRSPTTSDPTMSPTKPQSGIPSPSPTPAPTRPPTRDQSAPTPSPTLEPTKGPTKEFSDDVPEATVSQSNSNDSSDAFTVWVWLIIGLLSLLVICVLGWMIFCYINGRRERQKKAEEREKAYEEMENYRALHGLDIPEGAAKSGKNVEDDDEEDNPGVGHAAKSSVLKDHDSADEEDATTAGGAGAAAGAARKGSRADRKRPAYRKKDLQVADDDDDDVLTGLVVTPGGDTASGGVGDTGAGGGKRSSKFVTSAGGLDEDAPAAMDDDDDYDYEAARREREERRRKRAAKRKAVRQSGKFRQFDDNQW